MCMNLRKGGTGGFSKEQQIINSKRGNEKFIELMNDVVWRNKQCEKQSIGIKNFLKQKNINGFWDGKKHKQESKIKIGLTNSILQKNEKNSQYNTCWITNDIENKKIKRNNILPDGWHYGRKLKTNLKNWWFLQ